MSAGHIDSQDGAPNINELYEICLSECTVFSEARVCPIERYLFGERHENGIIGTRCGLRVMELVNGLVQAGYAMNCVML